MGGDKDIEDRKEGPYLIPFTVVVDRDCRIRWCWINQEQVAVACQEAPEEDLDRVGLLMPLSFEWARPHVSIL